MQQEQSVLRWGGLAGMLGSIVFIVVFVIVGVFVGDDPANIEGWVTRFPDIYTARLFENGLYLFVLVIWIPHMLALAYALRRAHLPLALFGSVISIVGLTIMIAGALTHVAVNPLYMLSQLPDMNTADQRSIALMWQATWGILDALLIAGLLLVPFGIAGLGVAMSADDRFGKLYAGITVGLGSIGLLAAIGAMIAPESLIAAGAVFALIFFNFIIGWKTFRLGSQPIPLKIVA
ncbi:MAG: hypothetical protein AAF846_02230 [Chloroflexota bacterium]